jgi:hypothetical protein
MEVRVALEPDAGADAEDVERLGRQLRTELRSLDVDDVSAVGSREAPPGAKGAGAALSEWLVTLSGSGGVFVILIATVKDWLGRHDGTHKIKVTIDGDTLELSSATPREQAELMQTFLQRHQTG